MHDTLEFLTWRCQSGVRYECFHEFRRKCGCGVKQFDSATSVEHNPNCVGHCSQSFHQSFFYINRIGSNTWTAVLNMIRFSDRDPTGFCNSEPDPDRTGFKKNSTASDMDIQTALITAVRCLIRVMILKQPEICKPLNLFEFLARNNSHTSFPNLFIALRIYFIVVLISFIRGWFRVLTGLDQIFQYYWIKIGLDNTMKILDWIRIAKIFDPFNATIHLWAKVIPAVMNGFMLF